MGNRVDHSTNPTFEAIRLCWHVDRSLAADGPAVRDIVMRPDGMVETAELVDGSRPIVANGGAQGLRLKERYRLRLLVRQPPPPSRG